MNNAVYLDFTYRPSFEEMLFQGIKKPRPGNDALYSPCKCGSGKKFKFCCYKKKARKQ